MADRKISDLTALTAPAAGDYLPIVDISEASAANKNKRITIEELLRGAPDGTAAAPSIGFESDPNTGIYRPGADQLAISTGGTARLLVDASGRFGVGTSAPSDQLEIANGTTDAANAVGIRSGRYLNAGQEGAQLKFYSDNTAFWLGTREMARIGTYGLSSDHRIGSLAFFLKTTNSAANPSEMMRLTSTGLGIGTASPSQALEVAGTAVFTGGVAGQGAYIYRDGGTGGAAYSAQTGDILLTTPGSNNIRFTVNTTERARIDSSGRLLVGTSSARSTSTVIWRSQIEGAGEFTGLGITTNQDSSGGAYLSLAKSRGTVLGSNTIVQNGDGLGYILFSGADGTDANTQAAFIGCEVDGTPGVDDMPGRLVFATTADGASSPTERLRIQGSGDLRIANATTFYPSVDNAISIGVNVLRFSAVFAANGTIQTSDEREKTEVAEAILGSDFVKSLRPVSYKWIEGGKRDTGERDESNNYIYESVPGQRTHWGFIAQEVKEAVDAAGVDFGGWVLTDKDDPGSQQALRYDQFIAPLTKALQEALAKIETLEAKVAALEGN